MTPSGWLLIAVVFLTPSSASPPTAFRQFVVQRFNTEAECRAAGEAVAKAMEPWTYLTARVSCESLPTKP
jgi:hypothetical protein